MPSFTKDGTAAAGRTLKAITKGVEGAVLMTLTVLDLSAASRPNSAYAEIGLMSGGKTPQHIIASLASGYIGRDQPVSWTGYIITEDEMYAYAHVYSTPGGDFRLAGLLTPFKMSAEGGLILDP